MKALTLLFRVVFSIIVLLLVTCYTQVTSTVSLTDFCTSLNASAIAEQFTSINAFTITLAVILLLSILSFTRLLEAIWNILFCGSIITLLAGGLYALCGPRIALPYVLYNNEAVMQFCSMVGAYQIPVAIVLLIFLAGWLCSAASGRVAITAIVSFGLWYAVTELLTYGIYLWTKAAAPDQPGALTMIQESPWILAAVPAAFFLIYALLMAFFETYITTEGKAQKAPANDKQPEKPATTQTEAPASTVDAQTEPITKTRPVLLKTTPIPEVPKKKLITNAPDSKEEIPVPVETEQKNETAATTSNEGADEPAPQETPVPEPEAKEDEAPKATPTEA